MVWQLLVMVRGDVLAIMYFMSSAVELACNNVWTMFSMHASVDVLKSGYAVKQVASIEGEVCLWYCDAPISFNWKLYLKRQASARMEMPITISFISRVISKSITAALSTGNPVFPFCASFLARLLLEILRFRDIPTVTQGACFFYIL